MDKNYYEILEVDSKASKEMIDRAFKLLAKRYHPDTQSEDKKEWAEENFKKINEAYETLSNENLRKEYDDTLVNDNEDVVQALCAKNAHLQKLVESLQDELNYIKSQYSNANNNYYNVNDASTSYEEENNTNNQNIPNSNSYEYYTEPKETFYYKRTYSHSKSKLKDLFSFIITIVLIIIIGIILWKIPITNKLLVNLYEENAPIRGVVDVILNIFK